MALYLRKIWTNKDWLFKDQLGFTPGYSCESQVITVCHFSKAFDLVPQDRLLTKIAALEVDLRAVGELQEEDNYRRKSE
jgi:hypothetical protein